MIVPVASRPANELFAAFSDTELRLFSFSRREQLCTVRCPETPREGACTIVPGEKPIVIVGAWNLHGVIGFDGTTGAQLWARTDLNHNQHVEFLGGEPHRPVVATAREDGHGWVLDAQNGKSVASLRAVRELYAEPRRHRFIAVERTELTLRDASTWAALAAPPLCRQRGRSLTYLDAAITSELFVVSRPRGDFGEARLEAFAHDGRKLWNAEAPPGCHYVRIEACAEGFAAIELDHQGGGSHYVELDAKGAVRARRPLPPHATHALFDEGRVLLTDEGVAVDAARFEPIWRFWA